MAHEQHSHVSTTAAHVHGQATLNMVISAGVVMAEFHSPLDNLLGFEHQPATSEQQQAYQAMLDNLQDANTIFTLNGGDCELASVQINDPFAETAKANSHNELAVEYTMDCADSTAINGLQTDLFSVYPRLQKIDVQLIRDAGQTAFTLTAKQAAQQW
ncbi:MAG: DUF2796 domain-containing protein [Methylophaga sp.]